MKENIRLGDMLKMYIRYLIEDRLATILEYDRINEGPSERRGIAIQIKEAINVIKSLRKELAEAYENNSNI